MFFIGSSVAFIMIVTPEQFRQHEKYWTKYFKQKHLQFMLEKEKELNRVKKARGKGGTAFTRRYMRAKEIYDSFKPLKDRQVIDVYDKLYGGTAVIVEGAEIGTYWLAEEYIDTGIKKVEAC